MTTLDTAVLSLGAGNMAHAILQGAQDAGALEEHQLAVLDPNADRRALFTLAFHSHEDAARWINAQDGEVPMILLAVKPQKLREAIEPLREALRAQGCRPCTWISILAGSRIDSIHSLVREQDRVIRVMPNTPAQLGLGMTAIATDNDPDPRDLDRVRTLFQAVGEVIEIPETLMDAFTAVAGSGPAYLFYLAEGMMRAAKSIGFSADQANTIVRQTILGSSQLLSGSTDSPGDLRAKVTSKNGTTYAATTTLDDQGVMEAVVAALTAARDRGRELASE
ncbi:MAG: pyrroline-5-carboxylate reductase [Phycisphaerales bacterium]|nr:pyrroline-5-carboxylate reductase [Phycisphaerales bacterium]